MRWTSAAARHAADLDWWRRIWIVGVGWWRMCWIVSIGGGGGLRAAGLRPTPTPKNPLPPNWPLSDPSFLKVVRMVSPSSGYMELVADCGNRMYILHCIGHSLEKYEDDVNENGNHQQMVKTSGWLKQLAAAHEKAQASRLMPTKLLSRWVPPGSI